MSTETTFNNNDFATAIDRNSPVDTSGNSPIHDLVGRSSPGVVGGCYVGGVRVAHEGLDMTDMAERLEQANPGSIQSIEFPANKADRMAFIREWQSKHAGAVKAGGLMTLLIPLAACGGSDSGSDGIGGGGFLFDGPISNALIWRDLDGDGVLDAGEPFNTSIADGSFNLPGSGGIMSALLTNSVDQTTGATMVAGAILKGQSGFGNIISPVTTMIVDIAQATAVDAANPTATEYLTAATTVLGNLNGLGTSSLAAGDLLNYNAVTASDTNTNIYIAEGQVLLSVMNVLGNASGGAVGPNVVLDQLAISIGAGAVDYRSAPSITALMTAIETAQGNTNIWANDAAVADMIARVTTEIYSVVTTDGYTSSTGSAAFNNANSANIMLAISAAAGNAGDLSGQTLTYNATEAISVGTVGLDALITAGAAVNYSDTAAHIGTGTKLTDLITVMNALVTPTTIVVTSGVLELTQAQFASAALFDVTAAGASIRIADTAALLAADAGGLIAIAGNPDVRVTDGATVAQITAIDAKTTGTLTYSLSDTTANLITDAGTLSNPATNITMTDAATVAQATTITAYTNSGTLTYSLSDTTANLVADAGTISNPATNIVMTDVATVAQATTITAYTNSGTLTYSLSDTTANLVTDAGTISNPATNITMTDGATVAQATTITAYTNGGTLTYGLSDTAANLVTDAGTISNPATNIVVTDGATVAQATTITAYTNGGTLTYGLSDTTANLVTDAGTLSNPATNITMTDAATVAQATTITAYTNSGTLTYSLDDSLVNIAGGGAVVTGATAYSLTDAAGALAVTQATQSVAAAASNIADYTFAFSLTTGVDTMTGTAGNDSFAGTYGNGAGPYTLNAGDILDGGAGVDTLTVTTGAEASTPGDGLWAGKTNFENLVLTSTGAGAQTVTTGAFFNAAFATGADLTVQTAAGAINVTMTPYTQTATINTIGVADGAHTILTGSGATTVNASGFSGAQTINGAGLTTVVADITGAGAQTIGTAVGGSVNLTSVNATIGGAGGQTITSTSASDVTIVANAFAGSQTIVTGAGNDTVTLTNAAASTVLLTTGGGNDTITLSSGDETINVAFGGEGADTFINFGTLGADVIDFTGVSNVTGTGITAGGFATTSIPGVLAQGLTTITGVNDAASLSTTDVAAFLVSLDGGAQAVSFANIDNIAYIAVDDGTDTGLYLADDTNGTTTIDAADLTLVFTFSGIADASLLTAAQFVDFA